ncbi:MAG: lysophospholipid acyltransferase family protein [Desulfotomaculaceae bacterium]|nr:lysophospholipid acyltransferase family protein [Desulfotomaculaceae bacterium]
MIFSLLKAGARLVLLVLRRWEIRGVENLPATGGVVLVANHVSYWDPVAIICAMKRQVFFMAKSELFKIPLVSYAVRSSGAIPVRRDVTDRNAVRTALRLLQAGEVVGIFPEGTRSKSEEMLKPHLGSAMIALKAGTPVVPVAVSGTRGMFGKITVYVGSPIHFQSVTKATKADLESVSDRIMSEIALLLGS